MRTGVLEGKERWKSGYEAFANSSFSQATYEMQGPYAVISRGFVSNYTSFANDARAAYQNAIMCMPYPIFHFSWLLYGLMRVLCCRVHNQGQSPLDPLNNNPRRLGHKPYRYNRN